MRPKTRIWLAGCCALLTTVGMPASSHEHDASHAAHATMDHSAMGHGAAAVPDEHAAHRAQMTSNELKVSRQSYSLPSVTLRDAQGRSIGLADAVDDGRPVVLNFIYTSCTTICPVMTATILQVQRELASRADRPDFVSISIDPDFDSPKVLTTYAKRHGANWTFLTGSRSDVLDTLKHFDAWRGSKGNHVALTLLRPKGSASWIRVEGLASAQQLAAIWANPPK